MAYNQNDAVRLGQMLAMGDRAAGYTAEVARAAAAAIEQREATGNKTTTISSESTDVQYPSAKAVYTLFSSIVNGNGVSY